MSDAETRQHVPLLDLDPELERHADEFLEALERVMRSGRFILGPEVEGFEAEAADYLGVDHAVGVNSGTDALVIALRALGIGEGDEVITTSFTFFATAESIGMVGANPVFVDIEPESLNLDPGRLENAITDRTQAILPVHLFGRPAEMDEILDIADRHDVAVIEDCAQSFGARYDGGQTGSLGDAGAYSFFPSKNLGGFGDGGLIATDDDEVAEVARMLRAHGGKDKYHNEMLGYNSRLDALQAAVLRVKLEHIDEQNRGRREVARRYGELLADVPGVTTPDVTDGHVFHQYTVRVTEGRRDELRDALEQQGVSTAVYYPVPCHRLPVYEDRDFRELPETERAAEEVVSLPIWPQMDAGRQEAVSDAIRKALVG
jgi:dTDP-4-amino-4,6-dideoxygalactose transaminase